MDRIGQGFASAFRALLPSDYTPSNDKPYYYKKKMLSHTYKHLLS